MAATRMAAAHVKDKTDSSCEEVTVECCDHDVPYYDKSMIDKECKKAGAFWSDQFHGKHVVCLGGCGGLGSTITKTLAAAGAKITVIDALVEKNYWDRKEEVAQTKEHLKSLGVFFVTGDSANEQSIKHAISSAVADHGKIDVLIDTSWRWVPLPPSGAPKNSVLTADSESWDIALSNFKGAALAIKHVTPHMPKGGAIVMCGGCAEQTAAPSFVGTTFAAPLAGRNQLARDAAVELACKGIRVNVVNPGPMADTPLWQHLGNKVFGSPDNCFKTLLKPSGMLSCCTQQRVGTSNEVTNAFLYLASDLSSYTTGQKIQVTGGAITGLPYGAMDAKFNKFPGACCSKEEAAECCNKAEAAADKGPPKMKRRNSERV